MKRLMDKGFSQGFQRTNAQVLRKEISFLVRFFLAAKGSTLPLNPVAEAPSQRASPWTHETFVLYESIPARVLRHRGVPGVGGWGGGQRLVSGCRKLCPFPAV